MSSRIHFVPSPFDRLDPLAAAIRWWTTQMIDIIGTPLRTPIRPASLEEKKRSPAHAAVTLDDKDAFVAKLVLPKGSAAAHESAIKLRLLDLAPTELKHLQIAAMAISRAQDGSVTYAVAMARRARLAELEIKAQRKGARSAIFYADGLPEIGLRSEGAEQRRRHILVLDAAIVASVLIAAIASATVWTTRIDVETATLAERERVYRRAVIVSETAQRDADLARDFVDRGVLDRRAGALLETLAMLNEATPEGAWWTHVRWSPDEVTISARALDAARAIEFLSGEAKSWTVELSGAINAGAPQSFEIRLRPRKAPTP